MSVHEILENLYFIERGYLNGNHFVLRSDKPVLIDTAYRADFRETEKLIRVAGVRLEDVALIVNTHTHCDHIGGNKIIQDMSGCEILLHKAGRYFVDTRDDWATWWRYFDQEADFFECTGELDDGESVFIGPYEFEVLHMPGHGSDQIALYNRENRLLISSDVLWESDMAVINVRVEGSLSIFHMQESLERLSRLEVDMVYPGHGRPFRDFKGALRRSRKRLNSYFSERKKIGEDLIKKIVVYTLMMKKGFQEDDFFEYLMNLIWFRETVDFYFNGEYKKKYEEIMSSFLGRGVVKRLNGRVVTTVKP